MFKIVWRLNNAHWEWQSYYMCLSHSQSLSHSAATLIWLNIIDNISKLYFSLGILPGRTTEKRINTTTYPPIEIHLSHILSLKKKKLDLQIQKEITKKTAYTFSVNIQSSPLINYGSFTLPPEGSRRNKKNSFGLRSLSFRSLRR